MTNQYTVEIMIENGHDIKDAKFNITASSEDDAHLFGYKAAEQLGFSVSQIVGVLVTPSTKTIFGLFANGELDQVCYSEQDARREAQDLVLLGCSDIRIYSLQGEHSETCLDEMNEVFRMGKPFGRKGMLRAKEHSGTIINIIYQQN